MNLRIYYYTEDHKNLQHPIHNVMERAAQNAQPRMDDKDWVSWGLREYIPDHPEITETGVKKGGILIWDWDNKIALKLLSPAQANANAIANALKKLWGYEFDPANGQYVSQDGTNSVLPPHDGPLPGFPIWSFSINLPLPWWVWGIGSALSASQAISSRGVIGKVFWGTVSSVTAANAYHKYRN